MVTKIKKWGNSQGVRFPKQILRQARIEVGDDVEITTRGTEIVIRQAGPVRGKYKIEELVARLPKNYRPKEVSWGKPVGKEVW